MHEHDHEQDKPTPPTTTSEDQSLIYSPTPPTPPSPFDLDCLHSTPRPQALIRISCRYVLVALCASAPLVSRLLSYDSSLLWSSVVDPRAVVVAAALPRTAAQLVLLVEGVCGCVGGFFC